MSTNLLLEKDKGEEQLLYGDFVDDVLTYEEALEKSGANGRYQYRIAFLISLGMIIAGLQVMSFPFILQSTDVQCLNDEGEWYSCIPDHNTCLNPVRAAPGADNTVINRFNLFCQQDRSKVIVETLYMVASACGVITIAPLADRYGKRIALLMSYLATCISLCICPFSPNWIVFLLCVVVSGLGRAPFIYYGYQLLVEVSNEKFRAFGVLVMGVTFALGAAVAGILDEAVGYNWQRFYLFFLSIPSALCLPFVFMWAQESPLSYFPSHQYDKAKQRLSIIAEINQKKVLPFSFDEEVRRISSMKNLKERGYYETIQKYSYVDLFRYKSLRGATIGGAYISFATYFIFYGQMLAVDSFSTNPVLVSVITSTFEALSCIASMKFLTKYSRRSVLMLSFLITATSFIVFQILKPSNFCDPSHEVCAQLQEWIGLVELSIGRFWIAMLMCTTFVYANELFPTVIRSRGSGLVNFCGRIGSMIPSSVVVICNTLNVSPALVFGIVAIPGIFISFHMRETKGRALSNFISEVEEADKARQSTFIE